MTTQTADHWALAQFYISKGILPIPSKLGTKQMRLEHCAACKIRIQNARANGGRVDYKKCTKCDKLKDITTPERALRH